MTEVRTVTEMAKSGTVAIFSPGQHGHLIPYLAAIHASCITHDRTIAEFLPPLSHEKLLAWWKERIAEVADGKRLIFILLNQTEPGVRPKGPDVVGVVMLYMPSSETGPFRGVVEKLFVHTACRRRGGAKTLMSTLESEATKRGRTILLLETETGSPGSEVCKKLGYVELGQIPKYGLSPTGELKDGTFFWKHLAL
ncbi:hypothetical protein NXS19_010014 [Fusarium pseudograminearum]|uniref:N-acetyltransferase domain-containing protein n=1 Tax=Fusarium pseudograminearum (strain CS3096) TaxID=1028729 RepID=K3UX63_FUSPC|nr:hypothetical protein FPSE_02531 [Fusarium pseudograminearum CS3096]EKJ77256.1 hypothetical protein FPSE_02531 [Fusarium pseudograminearum CS3096]KAF0640494.1 hypothetical protein FPSE5266_02531 [Fusarium pseudograminearum]UZP42198.1 hypothetical protein NXS19_010014 [Fusarium pseudograminearum]